MSKFGCRLVVLALSVPVLAGAAIAQNTPREFVAVPGLRPAVALGDVSAIARTGETAAGRRVMVSAPAGGDSQQLGPRGAGDDGAPTMIALPDGDFLVVAARWTARGAELWAQQGNADRWRRARRLRHAGTADHHPALAVGDHSVWLVWVTEDAAGSSSLVAAAWDGRALSVPERLPSAGGVPGVPAIAIDAAEQPAVVWSADDGTDTEVWMSRRTEAGWSSPEPLTDNDVPDEFPGIGNGETRGLVVSWSSYTPVGYQPFATHELAGGAFAAPERLDTGAAGATTVLGGEDGAIAWTAILPTSYELRLSARNTRGWRRPASIGEVGSSRPHAALRGDHLLVATSTTAHAEGTLRRSRGPMHPGADLGLRPVATQAAPLADALSLPGCYRGFGDSITLGTIRFDGVVTESDGYPVPLATYIAAFLNRTNLIVENAGVGGEVTADGLGRLAGLNARSPKLYTFIMEGANDATHLVAASTVAANLRGMVRSTNDAGGLAILSTVTPRTTGGFTGGSNTFINTTSRATRTWPRSGSAGCSLCSRPCCKAKMTRPLLPERLLASALTALIPDSERPRVVSPHISPQGDSGRDARRPRPRRPKGCFRAERTVAPLPLAVRYRRRRVHLG